MKAVFFDMDGTLLPMDNDYFLDGYFKALCTCFAPYGYEAKGLIDCLMKGTYKMILNDGTRTNEEVFWEYFVKIYGEEKLLADKSKFDDFYETTFDKTKERTGFTEEARKTVDSLKARGVKVAVATAPVFPQIAIYKRVGWAGLDLDALDYVTTYENSSYCKPNPEYYRDLAEKLGLDPKDCVMVGNDVDDDMSAQTAGLKVFLLTDNLINRKGADINAYPHGGWQELQKFLAEN